MISKLSIVWAQTVVAHGRVITTSATHACFRERERERETRSAPLLHSNRKCTQQLLMYGTHSRQPLGRSDSGQTVPPPAATTISHRLLRVPPTAYRDGANPCLTNAYLISVIYIQTYVTNTRYIHTSKGCALRQPGPYCCSRAVGTCFVK